MRSIASGQALLASEVGHGSSSLFLGRETTEVVQAVVETHVRRPAASLRVPAHASVARCSPAIEDCSIGGVVAMSANPEVRAPVVCTDTIDMIDHNAVSRSQPEHKAVHHRPYGDQGRGAGGAGEVAALGHGEPGETLDEIAELRVVEPLYLTAVFAGDHDESGPVFAGRVHVGHVSTAAWVAVEPVQSVVASAVAVAAVRPSAVIKAARTLSHVDSNQSAIPRDGASRRRGFSCAQSSASTQVGGLG
jgi:hypothetical protein